uniref:Uncharacterized protein n=1 Tax=Acrobeloides nanus TaxID=290746 RepID=A0A914C4X3_9BILA
MVGTRKKKVKGIKLDPEDVGFDYQTNSSSLEPKYVNTKYGPKMVAGYVSSGELNKSNAPILTKFPILGDLFLIFRSDYVLNEMVPFADLKNFLKERIDKDSANAQVLYHFLARDQDLMEAVNEFQYITMHQQGDEYFVKKMPMPDDTF